MRAAEFISISSQSSFPVAVRDETEPYAEGSTDQAHSLNLELMDQVLGLVGQLQPLTCVLRRLQH